MFWGVASPSGEMRATFGHAQALSLDEPRAKKTPGPTAGTQIGGQLEKHLRAAQRHEFGLLLFCMLHRGVAVAALLLPGNGDSATTAAPMLYHIC